MAAAAQPKVPKVPEATASRVLRDEEAEFLHRNRAVMAARQHLRFAMVPLHRGAHRLFCTSVVGDMEAAQEGLRQCHHAWRDFRRQVREQFCHQRQRWAEVANNDDDDSDEELSNLLGEVQERLDQQHGRGRQHRPDQL